MAGNSFGRLFTLTTFGESHGPAIGVVIDGTPPLIELNEAIIQTELDRRKPGQSSVTTARKEADRVEILSGVFEGKTTGTPIALLIRNQDQRSRDYSSIKDVFRPGHADFTFLEKFGIRDYRGGGRSSGRETAARVAAGAVAKQVLKQKGIFVTAYTSAVGHIKGEQVDFSFIEQNIVRAADSEKVPEMIQLIENAKQEGDSIGGAVEAIVKGCPAGLGDPVFDKLEAVIAHGLMSIGTIKGVEFGEGFSASVKKGSENNDVFEMKNGKVSTKTNFSGGILGGISTGQDIVCRVAVKPPSSINKSQDTVTVDGKEKSIQVQGRHDPCICPRVVPVVESMLAVIILDALLIQKSI